MKDKKIKIIAVSSILLLVCIAVYIRFAIYKQNNISSIEKAGVANADESPINNYLVSTSTSSEGNIKTLYADGRVSDVRKINYYNYLVKNSEPFGDSPAAKLGLITIITEWNKYDANVAGPQGGFMQVENDSQFITKMREELKKVVQIRV